MPLRGVLLLAAAAIAFPAEPTPEGGATITLSRLSSGFEPNYGQHETKVRFASRFSGCDVWLTSSQAVLLFGGDTIRLSLAGANSAPRIAALDLLPGTSNYFTGSDRRRWRTNVPRYARVAYYDVYPGITLMYYRNGEHLEQDFILAPGADPSPIRIRFEGARKLSDGPDGSLILSARGGVLRLRRPGVYQDSHGTRRAIDGRYLRKGPNEIGFVVGGYDVARPLIIDPELEVKPSFTLGGAGDNSVFQAATDSAGNVYVTGRTSSQNFLTGVALQSGYGGGLYDAFVAKFDPTLKNLIYATYLGGSGQDEGHGIAVDSSGSAYVTGATTSRDFPIRAARQATLNGVSDAFVTKLSPSGSELVYSTYLGGSFGEAANAIALDGDGNAYVSGFTTSADFPLASPARSVYGGNLDAFVAKLSATGSSLAYSTFLGGSATDVATAIAVTASGQAYVAGYTASGNFPVQDAYQTAGGGRQDGFLTRLSAQGASIEYSTYLGGAGDDMVDSLALDSAGGVWMVGTTNSSNLPVTPDARQRAFGGGGSEAFLARFPTGPRLAPNSGSNYVSYVGAPGASGAAAVFAQSLYFIINIVDRGSGCANGRTVRLLRIVDFPAAWSLQTLASACGSCGGLGILPDFLSLFTNEPKPASGTREITDSKATPVPIPVSVPVTPGVGQTGGSATAGDPVSTATGELFASETDLSLGGPLPLAFTRYYGSLLKDNGIVGTLGNNWMHNFEMKLVVAGSTATVVLFGGRLLQFRQLFGGIWLPAGRPQFNYQLAGAGLEYRFLDGERNLTYTFSLSGALTRIEDRNGNALTVSQSASGPLQVSDGLGRSLAFTYAAGKLARVQDQTGRSVQFDYSGDDLIRVTDARNKVSSYSYTSAGGMSGLLASKTLPAGNRPLTQAFDARGRVAKQSDSRGNTTSIDYNRPAGGETTVTDPLAVSVRHRHQNLANFTGYTDPAGRSMAVTYDTENRPTSVTDRFGDKVAISYHERSGYPQSYTDALGNTTTYSYSAQTQGLFVFYNLTGIVYPDGRSVSMTYDPAGNVIALTDRAGKTWNYTYNPRGQLLTAGNPSGGVSRFSYNADGTIASFQPPGGEMATFAYDDKKRLARAAHADGTFRSFTYDNVDNLLQTTDERDNTSSFVFDDNNSLRSLADALNQTATLQYDTDQRISSVADWAGNTSSFTYDEAGRLKTATNPAGDSLTFGYDPENRLNSVSNCSGKVARATYDREGVVASLMDPLSRVWAFASDKKGRITRVTSPLSAVAEFAYDKMGRLASVTNPLSQVMRYAYDERGLLSGIFLPGDISLSIARNELGRIAQVADPNGSAWQQSFDSAGRLISRTDPLGRIVSYTYDSRGRIAKITFPEGFVSLTYDEAGNLTRRLYSDGTDLRYAYDKNGRLVSGPALALAYDPGGRLVLSNTLRISRDEAGRIAAITYAPGKTVRYTYDCRGLVTQVTDWIGGSTNLTYDDAGQLVSLSRPNGVVTQYTYDGDGRLSSITEVKGDPLSSLVLARDAEGTIVSVETNGPAGAGPAEGRQQFSYDAAHQVSGAAYDSLGRLTGDGALSYTWDLAWRLTSYAQGDTATAFTYDGIGLPVTRGSQSYLWNYALGLPSLAVVREGDNDRRYYIHLPGGSLLYGVDADNSRHYYHFDHLGSTSILTGDDGQVTDSYQFGPYGELLGATGGTENPFTYLGGWGVMQEGATGLYAMRFRFYDSNSARFVSPDPAAGLENRYGYARANPVRYVDPLGLQSAPLLQHRPAAGPEDPGLRKLGGLFGMLLAQTIGMAYFNMDADAGLFGTEPQRRWSPADPLPTQTYREAPRKAGAMFRPTPPLASPAGAGPSRGSPDRSPAGPWLTDPGLATISMAAQTMLLWLPSYIELRQRPSIASGENAGRNVKTAQELWFQDSSVVYPDWFLDWGWRVAWQLEQSGFPGIPSPKRSAATGEPVPWEADDSARVMQFLDWLLGKR